MVVETSNIPCYAIQSQAMDSTNPKTVTGWFVAYSKNPAEIALNEIRASFDETDLDELLEGMEETKQTVFEKFYGARK